MNISFSDLCQIWILSLRLNSILALYHLLDFVSKFFCDDKLSDVKLDITDSVSLMSFKITECATFLYPSCLQLSSVSNVLSIVSNRPPVVTFQGSKDTYFFSRLC